MSIRSQDTINNNWYILILYLFCAIIHDQLIIDFFAVNDLLQYLASSSTAAAAASWFVPLAASLLTRGQWGQQFQATKIDCISKLSSSTEVAIPLVLIASISPIGQSFEPIRSLEWELKTYIFVQFSAGSSATHFYGIFLQAKIQTAETICKMSD